MKSGWIFGAPQIEMLLDQPATFGWSHTNNRIHAFRELFRICRVFVNFNCKQCSINSIWKNKFSLSQPQMFLAMTCFINRKHFLSLSKHGLLLDFSVYIYHQIHILRCNVKIDFNSVKIPRNDLEWCAATVNLLSLLLPLLVHELKHHQMNNVSTKSVQNFYSS